MSVRRLHPVPFATFIRRRAMILGAHWMLVAGAGGLVGGCVTSPPAPGDWAEWKAKRLESVAGTQGWTTLVGLSWLKEGANSAGSAATNDAVFPSGRAPAHAGTFTRSGADVRFDAAPGVVVWVEDRQVRSALLENDRSNAPTRLRLGGLTVVVIARGERLGLRVRDPEAPDRLHFPGLRCFPYDPSWRITGRFEAFPSPRTLRVPSLIGGTQDYSSPGAIVFDHQGHEYRLDVAVEPGETDYFVMFRDGTAGGATYGSGRFIYVTPPGPDGRVLIDFNRAYTPPCGFTAFATCPLPPRQNRLPFSIEAGEMKPAGHP